MSLSRILRGARIGRRTALASALLPAALVVSTPAAQAAPISLNLNYTCNFPLMAPQPLALKITSDVPATSPVGEPTGAFAIQASADVSAQASFGLRALEAVSIEGTANAAARLTKPNGSGLNLSVPTTITKTTLPASGGFTTTATGETPSLTLDDIGDHVITIGDLVLDLTPRLPDGTLSGVDRFESECFQAPGQNNVFATIKVVDETVDNQAPSVPGGLSSVPGENSVALSWSPSTDNVAVAGYDVYRDGQLAASVSGNTTTATISGLTASTSYGFTVRARDAAGNASAQSSELRVSTTGGGNTVRVYNTAGAAVIKTLTRGTIPLKGTANASFTGAGDLSADLVFSQSSARLTALGFLPVTAKVAFVPSGKTTGKLASGVLTTNTKLRTKIQEVKLFGAIPLAGGNSCQTRNLADVKLVSGANFAIATGGTLNGTFTISDLNGCGALNGLVSPLTAGGGNTISLTLTPQATA